MMKLLKEYFYKNSFKSSESIMHKMKLNVGPLFAIRTERGGSKILDERDPNASKSRK